MARVTIPLERLSTLSRVCVCCGKPATQVRQQEFQVNTAASLAMMAATAALGALLWTKKGITLSLPVCTYHRRRGRQSNKTFFKGFILTIIAGVAAWILSEFDSPAAKYFAIGSAIAFIATMVAAMSEFDDGLKVKAGEKQSLTMSGVHRNFADALNATF